jgi:hypothetical protein
MQLWSALPWSALSEPLHFRAFAHRAVIDARFARCDVRCVAAVFIGADRTEKRCSVISSCRSAARTSRNPPTSSSLADENRVRWFPYVLLAALAEAGARQPLPSWLAFARSSRTAARQPGSARRRAITDAHARFWRVRASRVESAYFVVARRQKARPLVPPQHGGARLPTLTPEATRVSPMRG